MGDLMDSLHANEVDVAILYQAPPALRYRVLRAGVLLYCRDRDQMIAFRMRTVNDYLDFKLILERHERALIERARKGELFDGYNHHRGALDIKRSLSVIVDSVNALRQLQTLTYDEFARDHVIHGSAERDFQVAIQAALDIASMILADLSVDIPSEYSALFLKLAEAGIIPNEITQKLVGMAKFRNVLVHLYLEVDLKRVHQYLQSDLDDFEQYVKYIGEYLSQNPELGYPCNAV